MGRRSINTTKSGKYMNPTDQARKEARKQELKKNKKQRQLVRAAVLKGKDPQQILEEMEKIDQMEFNVNQPSPLNEKVLKDKRKKLRDTLERVLTMYYKDDQEKWADLKRRQNEYEQKKNQLVAFYESVKSAQQVTVDEIPLPQIPQQPSINAASQIPLPKNERKPEHTIYSIATALKLQALGQPIREPPGCPPGPPPELDDEGEPLEFGAKSIVEEEFEEVEEDVAAEIEQPQLTSPSAKKPTSLQQKMVALSGQNVDEFMKEMETVQRRLEGKEEDRESRAKVNVHIEPPAPPGTTDILPTLTSSIMLPPGAPTANRSIMPPAAPPGRPLMPPGPPPGMPPPRMPPIRPAGIPVPGPPPPPRLVRLPPPPATNPAATAANAAVAAATVLSAAPQLINRSETSGSKQGVTISAKPQIRNLSADVTRFVPSTLRVKRDDKKPTKNPSAIAREMKQKELSMQQSVMAATGATKDDAYKQFMQEMEQLI
ncbi:unnamed protein product [Acanthoscelides obtectus]|uniref:Wbp11/ELF5/Saf1 N-terminal domain-containing protein n=1 Tax=Acanthoscelides obtectus TaxID=200917 RepID=A0A9P0JUB6_ACAOB|nr:unnamed protein product [Acanthoscelides obtectus]CAK1640792.1 WW domain-binding protein 11 [Acanthoscelides obtectus]